MFSVPAVQSAAVMGLVLAMVAGSIPNELSAADDYQLGPDSKVQEGVPQGTVTKRTWKSEKVYPGTERDYWIYVPRQYDGSQPANVMVFQDGGSYVSAEGQFSVRRSSSTI